MSDAKADFRRKSNACVGIRKNVFSKNVRCNWCSVQVDRLSMGAQPYLGATTFTTPHIEATLGTSTRLRNSAISCTERAHIANSLIPNVVARSPFLANVTRSSSRFRPPPPSSVAVRSRVVPGFALWKGASLGHETAVRSILIPFTCSWHTFFPGR